MGMVFLEQYPLLHWYTISLSQNRWWEDKVCRTAYGYWISHSMIGPYGIESDLTLPSNGKDQLACKLEESCPYQHIWSALVQSPKTLNLQSDGRAQDPGEIASRIKVRVHKEVYFQHWEMDSLKAPRWSVLGLPGSRTIPIYRPKLECLPTDTPTDLCFHLLPFRTKGEDKS